MRILKYMFMILILSLPQAMVSAQESTPVDASAQNVALPLISGSFTQASINALDEIGKAESDTPDAKSTSENDKKLPSAPKVLGDNLTQKDIDKIKKDRIKDEKKKKLAKAQALREKKKKEQDKINAQKKEQARLDKMKKDRTKLLDNLLLNENLRNPNHNRKTYNR